LYKNLLLDERYHSYSISLGYYAIWVFLYQGKEGIMGKKSKISFWPSSKRPKESAIELETVHVGASIVSGSLGRGGLVVADASPPGIGTMFVSLSLEMAVLALYRGSSSGAKGGAFCMGLSEPLYEGTGPSPGSDV
jgi:hypothetical protein